MKIKNIAIIIQARTGSSRLPNKVLMPFFEDVGILELLIEKIRKIDDTLPIIIATTNSVKDDAIITIAKRLNTLIYRGDEQDVLKRFIDAAKQFKVDTILRICSDNPFLDLDCLKYLMERSKGSIPDYISFCKTDGTPTIKTHYGFWAELVKLDALEIVQNQTNDLFYHEHVTNYIYFNPNKFNIELIPISEALSQRNDIRMTIDTKEDFDNLRTIYSYFKSNQIDETISNLVKYIDEHEDSRLKMVEQIKINSK